MEQEPGWDQLNDTFSQLTERLEETHVRHQVESDRLTTLLQVATDEAQHYKNLAEFEQEKREAASNGPIPTCKQKCEKLEKEVERYRNRFQQKRKRNGNNDECQ